MIGKSEEVVGANRAGLIIGLFVIAAGDAAGIDPGAPAPSLILLNEIALDALIPGLSIPKGTSSSSSSISRWVLADSLGLLIFFLKAAAETLADAAM